VEGTKAGRLGNHEAQARGRVFATTHCSVVLAAGQNQSARSTGALELLLGCTNSDQGCGQGEIRRIGLALKLAIDLALVIVVLGTFGH
jgi:hypothetical protein